MFFNKKPETSTKLTQEEEIIKLIEQYEQEGPEQEVQNEGIISSIGYILTKNPQLIPVVAGAVFTTGAIAKEIYDKSQIKKTIDHWAEDVYNRIFARVSYNKQDDTITIKGINYDKLLLRLKTIFKEKRISDNFDFSYQIMSTILFNLRIENRKDMTKTAITMPAFFALEMQMLFDTLANEFNFNYYRYLQSAIVNKTWVKDLGSVTADVPQINLSKTNSRLAYTLKPHQAEFVENYNRLKSGPGLEGLILSFEQGLGKTLTAAALADALGKEQIIIACPNTIRENWANELKEYFKEYANDDAKFYDEVYVTNSKKYKVTKNTKYFIVNHESIPSIFPYLSGSKDTMIVIDEVHFFRNMKGNRVGDMLKLKELTKSKDNLLMSGTPILAKPTEIIPSLMMIDPSFTKEAAVIYNRLFDVDSPSLSKIVNRRFGMIIYRRRKADVLSLPPKHELQLSLNLPNYDDYLIENVTEEIGKVYSQIYDEMRTNTSELQARYLQYVDHFSTANVLDRNTYRSYITNEVAKEARKSRHELSDKFFDEYNTRYVLPNIVSNDLKKEFIDLSKKFLDMRKSAMAQAIGKVLPPMRTKMYQEMFTNNKDEVIEMIKQNPKKTIIFSTMLGVVDTIYDELGKAGIKALKVVGETTNRQAIFDTFRDDDEYDVLVATSQTLSTGVTLVEANQVIFFGTPWRQGQMDQASDRVHRIGQTSEVYIYISVLNSAKPNLSTRMLEILNWSGDMSDSFVDGKDSNKFI